MGVTSPIRNPIVTFHVGPTIALKSSLRVFNHQLPIRTRPPGKLFKTSPLWRIKDVVFEAVAFGSSRSGIVGEILAGRTGSRRLLFETLLTLGPIVNVPFGFAVTAGAAAIRVQVKEFTSFTGTLRELSVTSLMGRPPVPIIEPFTVLFILTPGTAVGFEDQPFPKFAGAPGVGLVAPAVFRSGNLGQTSALNI